MVRWRRSLRMKDEESEWVFCSNQWQDCQCNSHMRRLGTKIGSVLMPFAPLRWGLGEKWKFLSPKVANSMTSVKLPGFHLPHLRPDRCDVNTLGDPVPGEDGKHCECLVKHGSPLAATPSCVRALRPFREAIEPAGPLASGRAASTCPGCCCVKRSPTATAPEASRPAISSRRGTFSKKSRTVSRMTQAGKDHGPEVWNVLEPLISLKFN